MEPVAPKKLLALLNGVRQRVFEGNDEVTPAFLKEHVFAEDEALTVELLGKLCGLCARVMKEAAYKAWEPSELEAILKNTQLPEHMQQVFVRFWSLHRGPLLEKARTNSSWNDELVHLSWRIDLQASSSRDGNVKVAQSKPSAIVEMEIGKKAVEGKEAVTDNNELIRFEMSAEQLKTVRESIRRIEGRLQALSGQAE